MEKNINMNNSELLSIEDIKQEQIKAEYDSDLENECKEILQSNFTELIEGHIIKEELDIGPEQFLKVHTNIESVSKNGKKSRRGKTKAKKSEWVCKFCNKDFIRNGALTKHIKYNCFKNPDKIIAVSKWFTCNICNKDYSRRDILTKHMLTHIEKDKFQCDECGKQYSTKDAIRTHINVKHLNIKSDTLCYLCNREFNDKTYRNSHIKYACPNNPNKIKRPTVKCSYCNKILSDKYSNFNHINYCLLNPNVKPCEFCNKPFSLKYEKDQHVKFECTKNPNKIEYKTPVICKCCKMTFSNERCLSRHIKNSCPMNKKKVRKFKCKFCDKMYCDKASRNNHMKHRCQNNDNIVLLKGNVCEYCNKAFAHRCNKDRHIRNNACPVLNETKKKELTPFQ